MPHMARFGFVSIDLFHRQLFIQPVRFAAIATTVGDPGRLTLTGAFVVDLVATAILLIVFVGATAKRAPAGFAPIAIGLVLVALHLMTHTLVKSAFNPARAIATAAFAGGKPLADLWVFVAAPLLGGVLGGLIGRWLQDE